MASPRINAVMAFKHELATRPGQHKGKERLHRQEIVSVKTKQYKVVVDLEKARTTICKQESYTLATIAAAETPNRRSGVGSRKGDKLIRL